jgi:chitin disaccharide deacetylase
MRLLLHADDFGASDDTVQATIECFERGALTSASIMPAMPATDRATEFARAHPQLDFGVHLTFVGDEDERPLSPQEEIDALVDAGGRFRPTRELRLRSLVRRLPEEQIEREASRQIEAVRDAGVDISHVDSHRHMHKLPSFRRALERVLPRFGIRRVRAVQDVYLRRPLRSPTYWLGGAWQRRLRQSFVTTDHMYMPTSAADGDWARPLLALATELPGPTLEVGVHPGFDDWRHQERESVLELATLARDEGHTLVSWKDVG